MFMEQTEVKSRLLSIEKSINKVSEIIENIKSDIIDLQQEI